MAQSAEQRFQTYGTDVCADEAATGQPSYYQPALPPRDAPTQCGDVFIYVDQCMHRRFKSRLNQGIYTLSHTPPDEAVETIDEVQTFESHLGKPKPLSRRHTIPRGRVQWSPYGKHAGDVVSGAVCKPYKPCGTPRIMTYPFEETTGISELLTIPYQLKHGAFPDIIAPDATCK
jgi:hypothetical protein